MGKWDQRYRSTQYIYGKTANDFLTAHHCRIPMGRVLSLAEGEGRNAVFLAEKGYEVTAVDSSTVGLDKAEQLAADRCVSVEWIHGDLAHFDLGEGRWDGIISIFCHLDPDIRTQLHPRVVHALKPGGILILEAYTPAQLERDTGGPPTVDLMMDKNLLTTEFKGLDFLHLKEVERNIVEGSYHTGPGMVVQVVAMKPKALSTDDAHRFSTSMGRP